MADAAPFVWPAYSWRAPDHRDRGRIRADIVWLRGTAFQLRRGSRPTQPLGRKERAGRDRNVLGRKKSAEHRWSAHRTAALMIRALVFDFDGLIVDTETPLIDAYAAVHATHGVAFDRT